MTERKVEEGLLNIISSVKDERYPLETCRLIQKRAKLLEAKHMIWEAIAEREDLQLSDKGTFSAAGKLFFENLNVVKYGKLIQRDTGNIKSEIRFNCVPNTNFHTTYKRSFSKLCSCFDRLKNDSHSPEDICDKHVDIAYEISFSCVSQDLSCPKKLISLSAVACNSHTFPDFEVVENDDVVMQMEEEEQEEEVDVQCTVCKTVIAHSLQMEQEGLVEIALKLRNILPKKWFHEKDIEEEVSCCSSDEECESSSEESSSAEKSCHGCDSKSCDGHNEYDSCCDDDMEAHPDDCQCFVMPIVSLLLSLPFYEKEFNAQYFIESLLFG